MVIRDDDLPGMIHTVRGVQVMLDSDLATLYGVESRRLNEQVKRNIERFPDAFCFKLTRNEFDALKSQIATIDDSNLRSQIATLESRRGRHRKYLPYAFTEQGVAMLSAVLRSETAIQTSISIINAFVEMRRYISANGGLLLRLNSLERRQVSHEIRTDERFEQVFDALELKNQTPVQGIFFDGQIFDAYVLVNDLLRQAKKSIVLIDNYVDDSVLLQFTKRLEGVSALILTRTVSKQLAQDLRKHNAQYPSITIREFPYSHDRFLILDGDAVYHLGASLKDLGKKWFAFSRMDKATLAMMSRVEDVVSTVDNEDMSP